VTMMGAGRPTERRMWMGAYQLNLVVLGRDTDRGENRLDVVRTRLLVATEGRQQVSRHVPHATKERNKR
jgi:hypothetical protein